MIMSHEIPVNDVKEDLLELYGPLLLQEETNVNEKAEGEANAYNAEDESKCKHCIHKTRSHRFWGPFVKFVKFTVHFYLGYSMKHLLLSNNQTTRQSQCKQQLMRQIWC